MSDPENLALSDGLLDVMRGAAEQALQLDEPFISPKAILLALLDDPALGRGLARVVSRAKVLDADVENRFGGVRALTESMRGERPAIDRYDTLCFKTRAGTASVWLSKDALGIFMEGAKRARLRYEARDLAIGLAAQARLAPGILAAIRVEPGVFSDAIPAIRNP